MANVAAKITDTCPSDPMAELETLSYELEMAYTLGDSEAVQDLYARIQDDVGCIDDEQVNPTQAAFIHKSMAIAAHQFGAENSAQLSLSAFKSLKPNWQPSEDYQKGDALVSLYRSLSVSPDSTPIASLNPTGQWYVDGTPAISFPVGRAAILQATDASGSLIYSGYVFSPKQIPNFAPPDVADADQGDSTEPLWLEPAQTPDFEPAYQPENAFESVAEKNPTTKKSVRVGGGVAGALLLGTSLAFMSGSIIVENQLRDPDMPLDELDGLRDQTNAYRGTALGLGLAAAGTFAVTWAIEW